jgi:hypothetical protein
MPRGGQMNPGAVHFKARVIFNINVNKALWKKMKRDVKAPPVGWRCTRMWSYVVLTCSDIDMMPNMTKAWCENFKALLHIIEEKNQ